MKLSTRSKFIIPLVSEKIKELNTPIELELNWYVNEKKFGKLIFLLSVCEKNCELLIYIIFISRICKKKKGYWWFKWLIGRITARGVMGRSMTWSG